MDSPPKLLVELRVMGKLRGRLGDVGRVMLQPAVCVEHSVERERVTVVIGDGEVIVWLRRW